MRIAIASGKGGTGKTTVAVNLALARGGVQLLDCDVEDPDAALFLRPAIDRETEVRVSVPEVVEERCDHCGACAGICAFRAIIVLPGQWLLTPGLCKDCGGCYEVCREGALRPRSRRIGTLMQGRADRKVEVVTGVLDPGEAMATPLVRRVKTLASSRRPVIVDAPPGTACSMVHAIEGADLCLLVTEPTPYGRHDLEQALDVANVTGIRCAVVINRCDLGDSGVRSLCERRGAPVLLEIPFDEALARAYAAGRPAVVEDDARWRPIFLDLWSRIETFAAEVEVSR
jgi:MinD superfamily P-loop ATPase